MCELCQLNIDDAKRVFSIYDDAHCGMLPAEEIRPALADMGYSFVEGPEFDKYIADAVKKSRRQFCSS